MKDVVLLFSGQGSQYVGMGKNIYDKYSIVKDIFEEASDTLNIDMKKLCFEGDLEKLSLTSNTQTAILTVSYAMFKVLTNEYGINPVYMAGHSLGEISAITCANAINFKDGLKIVKRRGELMQRASAEKSSMAAIIGVESKEVENVIDEIKNKGRIINIACYNSTLQNVISGEDEAVREAINKLETIAKKVSHLKVSGAFHTQLMAPVADEFEEELNKYKYNEFSIPVISNVNAKEYESSLEIVSNLKNQLTNPVLWTDIMKAIINKDSDYIIELGPKNTLSKLFKRYSNMSNIYAFDNKADLNKIDRNIGLKKDIDFNLVKSILVAASCTENNNFQNEKYSENVILPIKKIKNIYIALKETKREVTVEDLDKAVEALFLVLENKSVGNFEKKEILSELLKQTRYEEIKRKIASNII
ncbi:MAG: ACP S-malonyltransferase [Clostridium sp.]|nr:ACP S-malonyltransferase [Clostridium sp.]